MQLGTNVQTTGPQSIAPYAISPASSWAAAHWVDTDERAPSLLAELGIPLRCFHSERGYFFACFLPERGWYWASDAIPIHPERWALPLPRSGRRLLAF
jgi:hypothetical protein